MEIFKTITKWTDQVVDPKRIPATINKAFRMATGGQPGPIYVDLPIDILYTEMEEHEVLFPKNPHKLVRASGDPG